MRFGNSNASDYAMFSYKYSSCAMVGGVLGMVDLLFGAIHRQKVFPYGDRNVKIPQYAIQMMIRSNSKAVSLAPERYDL